MGNLQRVDLTLPGPGPDATLAGTTSNGGMKKNDYRGTIVLVGVVLLNLGGGAGGKAGYRARVDLLDADQSYLATLWRGYVKVGGNKPSVPGVPIQEGQFLRVSVAASSVGSTTSCSIAVRIQVDPEQAPFAGLIVDDPVGPASGPGDYRQVNLGDPAAGAAWPAQTVGAFTFERVDGAGSANNTTAAGGSARIYTLQLVESGNADVITCAEAHQAASLNGFLDAARGGTTPSVTSTGVDGTDRGITCPDVVLEPGHAWQFVLRNLGASDNLGQAYARVMDWAADPT